MKHLLFATILILCFVLPCGMAWGEEKGYISPFHCYIPSCNEPIAGLRGDYFTFEYCEKHKLEDEITKSYFGKLLVEDLQQQLSELKIEVAELRKMIRKEHPIIKYKCSCIEKFYLFDPELICVIDNCQCGCTK